MRISLPTNRKTCLLIGVLLFVITHRLPAPIQEVPESPPPAVAATAKPKPKRPKAKPAEPERGVKSTSKPSATAIRPKFAGTWVGVTHTFPWGDISQTITVNATETTMTMVSSNGPDAGSPRTVKAERVGDTLKGNFGNRGAYSLTALADGVTALVRLQAPFNDNTASYRRTMSE